MIDIVRFLNTVDQRAKIGTTGYDDEAEKNRKIQEVQTEAIGILAPFYEVNQQVRDALGPFVKPVPAATVTGSFPKPDGYVHLVSVSIDGWPSYPININQVGMTKKSAIRKPDLSKGVCFHFHSGNVINLLPDTQPVSVEYVYIRQPAEAKIAYTAVSEADNAYLVPSTVPGAVVDLEWPEMVFNLLLYLYLEKLGIEMKEQLMVEYANLGISKELIKTNPKP